MVNKKILKAFKKDADSNIKISSIKEKVPNSKKINNQPNIDFFKYSINQKAILNGLSPKIIESNIEKVHKRDLQHFINSIRISLEKLLKRNKIFLRDVILKNIIKKKIILIGTGGHAKVVLDIIKSENKFNVIGCVASDTNQTQFEGLPVFGTDEILPVIFEKGITNVFVAIGDNEIRKKIINLSKKIGFNIVTTIHPSALISKTAMISNGTCIMPGAIINSHALIGEGVIINTNSSVDHDCIVDNFSHLAPGSSLAGNVSIKEGSFLGIGTKVIPRVTIGAWSIIGAGGVVIKNIPDFSKALGVPAKVSKSKN